MITGSRYDEIRLLMEGYQRKLDGKGILQYWADKKNCTTNSTTSFYAHFTFVFQMPFSPESSYP